MKEANAYNPGKRNGWARGLIHFHTKFSDGFSSILRAGEIAVENGYDFLVVTDHLKDMVLRNKKTLVEYITACDEATKNLKIPIIPGGEIEIDWNTDLDSSQAHTLVFSVRDFAEQSRSEKAGAGPLSPWISADGKGTISELQDLLDKHDIPSMAAHQFQHCQVSSGKRKYSDYRYDLTRISRSRYIDFFYSTTVELLHETEDLILVNEYVTTDPDKMKAIYSGCDYHIGPETWRNPVVGKLFNGAALLWYANVNKPETENFISFAKEQLSHATYVYLGDNDLTEANMLNALRDGRTCVTRGSAEFANLKPVPSFTLVNKHPVEISLDLPKSFSEPRPRSVIVFRDGQVVHWKQYRIEECPIRFSWTDTEPLQGKHCYAVYVPSKFLSSPIIISS